MKQNEESGYAASEPFRRDPIGRLAATCGLYREVCNL